MDKAEKYRKIIEEIEALKALVRCDSRCLLKNHKGHDDLCSISLADEYVETIYGVLEVSDK